MGFTSKLKVLVKDFDLSSRDSKDEKKRENEQRKLEHEQRQLEERQQSRLIETSDRNVDDEKEEPVLHNLHRRETDSRRRAADSRRSSRAARERRESLRRPTNLDEYTSSLPPASNSKHPFDRPAESEERRYSFDRPRDRPHQRTQPSGDASLLPSQLTRNRQTSPTDSLSPFRTLSDSPAQRFGSDTISAIGSESRDERNNRLWLPDSPTGSSRAAVNGYPSATVSHEDLMAPVARKEFTYDPVNDLPEPLVLRKSVNNIESIMDRSRPTYELPRYDQEPLEIDNLRSSASPADLLSDIPDSTRNLSEDLFKICERLKAIEPNDKELAKCLSAEKAAKHIETLYHRAVSSWTTTQGRLRELERSQSDTRSLNRELERLRDNNRTLNMRIEDLQTVKEANADRHNLKDQLIEDRKKENLALQAKIDKLEDEHRIALSDSSANFEKRLHRDLFELRDSVSKLTRERDDLSRSNQNLSQMEQRWRNEATHFKRRHDDLHLQHKDALARHENEKRAAAHERQRLVDEHRGILAESARQQSQDMQAMRTQIESFDAEKSALETRHREALDAFKQEQQRLSQEAIATATAETSQQLADKIRELATAGDAHREATRQLEDAHRSQLTTLESEHTRQLDANTRRYRDQITDLRNQLSSQRDEARRAAEQAEQAHAAELDRNRRESNKKQAKLQGALVKRSAFKGIADERVKMLFGKVANGVDQFSRTCTSWDRAREATWPVSREMLDGHMNARLVKQSFVQNAVWTVLFHRIFEQPFAVFGEEGKRLFEGWTSTFYDDPSSSTAPTWPEATEKHEKWRYDEMQRCVDAIEKSGSGDSIIKPAFIKTLQDMADEIASMLSSVVHVSTSHKNAIKDIVRQAAKMWLELGVQRCRILVVLPPSSREEMRKPFRQRIENMVVQPEVRRLGNDRGEHLDTQEVVLCEIKQEDL